MEIVLPLFLLVLACVLGGTLSKFLKLPSLVGYIAAGLVVGSFGVGHIGDVAKLSEIGTILLLFSIGVELSFNRLTRFLKVALFGGIIQILAVTFFSFLILTSFGVANIPASVLAIGFSLSSTAVILKILGDKGELDTIHGGISFGWLLVQDLAVIPIMVILPILAGGVGGGVFSVVGISLLKAFAVVSLVVIIGKKLVPFLIHKVVGGESRELIVLSSVALALGTAFLTSLFGISPALGAFLAGVVISESQENHAIFAETRPLRDLFVALFFVTLGFLVDPFVIVSKFWLIMGLTLLVIVLKALIIFVITSVFGYKGKTAVVTAISLSQVGEFAFVIFSAAGAMSILSRNEISLGISVTLFSLLVTPILFSWAVPIWRYLKKLSRNNNTLNKIISSGERTASFDEEFNNHVVVCGYGRVGSWIGKVLTELSIPFVVVDYNRDIVKKLKDSGINAIYGDPSEPEILENLNIKNARALILAIPDRVAQETLIAYTQTVAPEVKIISRAHLDEDWQKLKMLKVHRVVQPEFEASLAIIKSLLVSMNKERIEIDSILKGLRISHK